MAGNEVVLLGCGDVAPVHEPVGPYSTLARPILATGDIRFGQCERIYSDRGALQPHGSAGSRLKPHLAEVFSDCGFNVLSVAGNHAMDYGEEALLDMIAMLRKKGMQVIGGGRNLEEARQPAVIEHNGVRLAFLAYCSILQEGHEAGPNKAGIAPLRVHTSYKPYEYQPGVPPRIITVPYEEDLAGMVEDIAKAKKAVNVVIVSLHWGVHFVPRMIAEYQPVVAKAAFDAGADLILGHHTHVPKAIEIQNGKVCFYSLGNFIISTKSGVKPGFAERMRPYGITPDPDEYPLNPHGADSHRSLIAKAVLSREGVKKVSFLPVQIDKQLRPEVLTRNSPRFDDAVKFMDWVSEGYQHKFTVDGDEVIVKN